VLLSAAEADVLRTAAARAGPDECCGLIEGTKTAQGWRVAALHETANVAADRRRHFLIDPQAQFDLLRALRGTGRSVIGCFHSHPGGPAQPSATDAAQARESDFVWLIAGGASEDGFTLAAFVFTEGDGFMALPLDMAPSP
jgi:proteasome lid subunit RPN8/RPN11